MLKVSQEKLSKMQLRNNRGFMAFKIAKVGSVIHGVLQENMKTYSSGALRSDSTGKGMFHLISPFALKRLALRYEGGAVQKGERNFEKGFPISRCVDSAMRHLNDQQSGNRSEDHLAAAAWQIFTAMHFEEMIKRGILPENLDDMPRYIPKCILRHQHQRNKKKLTHSLLLHSRGVKKYV